MPRTLSLRNATAFALVTSLAAIVACASSCAPTPTPQPIPPALASPLPTRIDLGTSLFKPGSPDFAEGAEASIDTKIAPLLAAARPLIIDIEAFSDPNFRIPRNPSATYRTPTALPLARAQTVKAYLESRGLTIRTLTAHAPNSPKNRPASRRIELVIAHELFPRSQ